MTTTVFELTRLEQAEASTHEEPAVRIDVSARDWREMVRTLAGTDEDELPLFGRLPG